MYSLVSPTWVDELVHASVDSTIQWIFHHTQFTWQVLSIFKLTQRHETNHVELLIAHSWSRREWNQNVKVGCIGKYFHCIFLGTNKVKTYCSLPPSTSPNPYPPLPLPSPSLSPSFSLSLSLPLPLPLPLPLSPPSLCTPLPTKTFTSWLLVIPEFGWPDLIYKNYQSPSFCSVKGKP